MNEVVLGLLASGRPRHGYELKREHDATFPRARPLAYGQLYATLGRLVRDERIRAVGVDQAGGPERTAYQLTERGRRDLGAWLGTPERPAVYVADALYTKVVLALLTEPDEHLARELLTQQHRIHAERMRELTAVKTAPGADLPDVVAADFALAHLDADLRWIRTTTERLAELRARIRAPSAGADSDVPAGDPAGELSGELSGELFGEGAGETAGEISAEIGDESMMEGR